MCVCVLLHGIFYSYQLTLAIAKAKAVIPPLYFTATRDNAKLSKGCHAIYTDIGYWLLLNLTYSYLLTCPSKHR